MKTKNGSVTGAHISPYPGAMGSHDLPAKPEGSISEFIEGNIKQRQAFKRQLNEEAPMRDFLNKWTSLLPTTDLGIIKEIHEEQRDDPHFKAMRELVGLGDDVVFYPTSVVQEPMRLLADVNIDFSACDLTGYNVDVPKFKLKDEYVFETSLVEQETKTMFIEAEEGENY